MMSNDNIEVVCQRETVVVWFRLREMKKLKERKLNGELTLPVLVQKS